MPRRATPSGRIDALGDTARGVLCGVFLIGGRLSFLDCVGAGVECCSPYLYGHVSARAASASESDDGRGRMGVLGMVQAAQAVGRPSAGRKGGGSQGSVEGV
jgi:hypothetical protein